MSERDKALWDLRNELATSSALSEDDLLELEGHLLDEIDMLTERGLSEDEAIVIARRRLGEPEALTREFEKAHPMRTWQAPLFWCATGALLVLAGMSLINSSTLLTFLVATKLNLNFSVLKALVWAMNFVAPTGFLAITAWFMRSRPIAQPPRQLWTIAAALAALIIVVDPWLSSWVFSQLRIGKDAWATLASTWQIASRLSLGVYAILGAWLLVKFRETSRTPRMTRS